MSDTEEDRAAVAGAIEHLKSARELLKSARCPKTLAKVRACISSAKGAQRHVNNRHLEVTHE